jgi:hypothetical protein
MNLCANIFQKDTRGFYTDICGYSHALYEQYTHCSKIVHDQILGILNNCQIPYFLFAGSMVGYVRNKQMPAWMDDLDIMIFEEHINEFWDVAAVKFLECGFVCQVVDPPFDGGGAHILGMQLGDSREHTIPLAAGIHKTVPWAQVDIFFSKITDDGIVKNLKSWGLYDSKNVPAEFIFPKRVVEIDGQQFPSFQEVEKDILLEYGDVLNNIVVGTHDKVFLRADGVPWKDFYADWYRHIEDTSSRFPLGVNAQLVVNHTYTKDREFTSASGMSLADIVRGINEVKASTVFLVDEIQLLYCCDLKRMLPDLKVCVTISSVRFANHAAHLRRYIDHTEFKIDDVHNHYNQVIGALGRNTAAEFVK